jgi:hypothetical protein
MYTVLQINSELYNSFMFEMKTVCLYCGFCFLIVNWLISLWVTSLICFSPQYTGLKDQLSILMYVSFLWCSDFFVVVSGLCVLAVCFFLVVSWLSVFFLYCPGCLFLSCIVLAVCLFLSCIVLAVSFL